MVCVALACAVAACGSKKQGIAELTSADGPVERQEGSDAWKAAQTGTQFFLGDAARTGDGGARLRLGNTTQTIAMQPHTVLRFGSKDGAVQLSVEIGQVKLAGTGKLALDIGDVTLDNDGAVVITAKGQGETTLELQVGKAQVTLADGSVRNLDIGQVVDLAIGKIAITAVVDAGVDAAPPPDAPAAVSGEAQIEVVGRKAEAQLPGETKWMALQPGTGTLPKGAKLRLGNGTTAKVTANGTSLDMTGGSKLTVDDDLLLGFELGSARAVVPAGTNGKVNVPGGDVAFTGPAEAKLDVTPRETKVTMLRGSAKLDGANGAALDMNRGESAALAKAGTIHVLEAIPSYFDMRVTIGETPSFTIHDPKGSTALQFAFGGKCGNGGVIEMDRDGRFRTPKVSGGKESANVLASAGGWAYRLRCTVGDSEGAPVASGRIVVVRDDGRRPLPKEPPQNPIDADGRTYRISYQSLVPNIKIKYVGDGSAFKLHLATGGEDETFDSAKPSFTVPGTKLKEATYTYWIDHDGVKQEKTSTLIINFDQTAPQVYIELPQNNQPFGADIEVKGAVLPGWSAKIEGAEIPIDSHSRRFTAKVQPPPGNALAIRLSHPQRGVHFYLRRQK